METHRPKLWWIIFLTVPCLIFLLIEGTAGSRHPRVTKTKRDATKLGTVDKSGAGVPLGREGQSVLQDSPAEGKDESGGRKMHDGLSEATTEISDLNFNATGTAQMTDHEAKGAVIYAVIFLFFYTSSIGMLILYNVNHHKKVSEHEEIKNAEREYHRGQEMIEVQKRAELYFQFKMLYGQESGGATPADGSETATPELKKKTFFTKTFSLREIPKFSKKSSSPTTQKFFNMPLARNMPTGTLPDIKRLTWQQTKRPPRFTLRPKTKRGLSFPPDLEEEANNENRRPKRQVSLGVSPPSDESGGEEELATQTWHPTSMTQQNRKIMQDVRRMSKAGSHGSIDGGEVSRVIVLKKNLLKDRETASAEEIKPIVSNV